MDKINIFEKDLNEQAKLFILIGGLNTPNPREFMNQYVENLVKENSYSEFIDKHMDNPYIRVIITNINSLEFDEQSSTR